MRGSASNGVECRFLCFLLSLRRSFPRRRAAIGFGSCTASTVIRHKTDGRYRGYLKAVTVSSLNDPCCKLMDKIYTVVITAISGTPHTEQHPPNRMSYWTNPVIVQICTESCILCCLLVHNTTFASYLDNFFYNIGSELRVSL